MPKSNRMTRSNRPARKAPKSSARTSKPAYKKRSVKPRVPYGGSKKEVIRQESLGGQTSNKCTLPALSRPDTRARYIKAVSTSSTYNKLIKFNILSGSTGLQGITASQIAPQSDLRLIADSLQNYLATGDSTVGTPVNAPARFLLENVHDVFDFSNRSSAPCTLKIYILQAKRDTWRTSTNIMTYNSPNGASVLWNGFPDDAMRAGIQAQSDPFQSTAGNDDWTNPGMTPRQSTIFNQYFKVEKEIEVEMAQGGVHQLTLHSLYDKMIDASLYANTPLVGIAGITRFLLFTAVGVPVVVSGDSTDMTTAAVNIGVIQTVRYKYTQSWAPVSVAFQDGNELTQTTFNLTAQVNPGSGGASAVVEA